MKAFAKRFARNKGAVIGVVIVVFVILVAAFASVMFPESPWNSVADPMLDPFSDRAYLFGTDMLGRDIAAGLAYGARMSLLVGLVSTAMATLFGITVGAVAGYYGGRAEDVLMRFTEFFQTIPALALAVVLVAIFTQASLRSSARSRSCHGHRWHVWYAENFYRCVHANLYSLRW